jgi:hypothetical protein
MVQSHAQAQWDLVGGSLQERDCLKYRLAFGEKCHAISLRSVVEDGIAARTMAAYIDLNPVRAGMVSDPADYRWSS